ncbi:DUF1304 family protein [Paenibacillus ihuae]
MWATPKGQKAFGTTAQVAKDSKSLAFNQGLYNGFWLRDGFGECCIRMRQ